MEKRILIADDEKNMIWALKKALNKEEYSIISATNGMEAVELFKEVTPNLVLLDLKMPKMNGIVAMKEMKRYNEQIPIIMLTAHGDTATAVEAMKIGALDYLSKPFDIEELKVIINKALDYKNLADKVTYLEEKLKEKDSPIIYESKKMETILQTSLKVASTGCTHDLLLRKMLQEEGMATEENGGTVKRITQKSSTMIGLFQQNQIDAAIVSEPWASLMEAE